MLNPAHSPMAEMNPPTLAEKPIRVLSDDQLRALLATCKGKGVVDRRDNAILRLFIDTGIRRAEMAGLKVDDVDVREQVAQVFGKGRRPRSVPFGVRTPRLSAATSACAPVTPTPMHPTSGSASGAGNR